MLNFNLYNPTHVVFGKDRLAELDQLIPKNKRIMMTFGGGSIKKYGTYDKVKAILDKRDVVEFSGIEPNPKFETLMKAVEVVKKQNINFLLAVGGGSVMDGTKFIATAAKYVGNDHEKLLFYGFNPIPLAESIPLGTVVTVPATGSEVNCAGVITYNDGKFPFVNPAAYPKFSLLDPELTYTLPPYQVASGIIDAFVHVAEFYLTFPVDARLQDRICEGIMQTLVEVGRKTMDAPEDYNARANFMWCAAQALSGITKSGVPQDWSTHMLGHEITALSGVNHGMSLAIILPSMLEKRKTQKREKLIQYAERVWNITNGSNDKKVVQAIAKTRAFFESLDIKTRLSDYDITKKDIDRMIAGLKTKGMTALSEHQDLSLDTSRRVYESSL